MTNPVVGFVGHPMSVSAWAQMAGCPHWLARWVGKEKIKLFLEKQKPKIITQIKNLTSSNGAKLDFVSVACPLLPEQMVSLPADQVVNTIVQSVELAKSRGAKLVALGGFTSVIGNEGADVAGRVRCAVTSGNTYTAALAIEGVCPASEIVGLDLASAKLAVLRATGDIGSAVASFFSHSVREIRLLARQKVALEALGETLRKNGPQVSTHTRVAEALLDADVIVSATSALTTIIETKQLKAGAIVCDVALPANIAREVSRQRPDVFVFEGGLSKVPGSQNIRDKKWQKLMPKNASYGCLAEALVLGFERRFENFSIGRGNITLDKIQDISNLSKKHGFKLSDFFCGDRFYHEKDIQLLKGIVQTSQMA